MLPECLMNVCQRKSSMEIYKLENAPMVVRRSDTRVPSKPPLKTSTYKQTIESWEQIAQDRAKWRGLIRRVAGECEAKRTGEAKQKRAQRKARAKASATEFLPQTSLVLSARGSIKLRLVSSAILEHFTHFII